MMKMNDKNVRIKLDTETEVNVMPTRVFSQIANTEDVEQSNVNFKGYGGSTIPVIGESIQSDVHTTTFSKMWNSKLSNHQTKQHLD